MNTIECIRRRSMYRGRLQSQKLTEEDLRQLVDAAGWAPSGHNSQPWEFLVVDDENTIASIARVASDNFDAFLANSSDLRRFVSNFSRWLRWSERELAEVGDGIFFESMPRKIWEELTELASDEEIRKRLSSLARHRVLFSHWSMPSGQSRTGPMT